MNFWCTLKGALWISLALYPCCFAENPQQQPQVVPEQPNPEVVPPGGEMVAPLVTPPPAQSALSDVKKEESQPITPDNAKFASGDATQGIPVPNTQPAQSNQQQAKEIVPKVNPEEQGKKAGVDEPKKAEVKTPETQKQAAGGDPQANAGKQDQGKKAGVDEPKKAEVKTPETQKQITGKDSSSNRAEGKKGDKTSDKNTGNTATDPKKDQKQSPKSDTKVKTGTEKEFGEACKGSDECKSKVCKEKCLQSNGGSCKVKEDCASDNCANEICTEKKTGDSCQSDLECLSRLSNLTCHNNKCLLKDGKGLCLNPTDCVSGVCEKIVSKTGVCLVRNGEKCDWIFSKNNPNACISKICVGGLCTGKAGDSCINGSQCGSGSCGSDGWCLGKIGDKCDKPEHCTQGLICEKNLCKKNFGDPCTTGEECASNYCLKTGVCGSKAGSRCKKTEDCESGLVCEKNLCKKNFGDDCMGDKDCGLDAECIHNKCFFPEGQPCSNHRDCLIGRCGANNKCSAACKRLEECPENQECKAIDGKVENARCVVKDLLPCSQNIQCASGSCRDSVCLVPLGGRCRNEGECADADLCDDDRCRNSFYGRCSRDSHCIKKFETYYEAKKKIIRIGGKLVCSKQGQCVGGHGFTCGDFKHCASGSCVLRRCTNPNK